LGIITWFKTDTFLSWVGYLAMTTIPIQLIIAMVWQNNYPPPAAKLEQPLKGIFLLFFAIIVASFVASLSQFTIGGSVSPAGINVTFFTILTVILSLWLIIVWGCWPMAAIYPHPAFVGFGTFFLAYVVAIVVYKTLLSFAFLKGAPIYVAALDPGGAFNAWAVITFGVTTVMVILAMAQMDFVPLSLLPRKFFSLGKQPIFGIIGTIWILAIAAIVWSIFIVGMGMPFVVYLVKVPISVIFGQFFMLLLLQTWPVQTTKQPAKGFVLVVLSVVLGLLMYQLWSWLSILLTGGLPPGPPMFAHDFWIATALLSITFPVISVYTGFFGYWPLIEPKPAPPPGT
jgi:hypothetical protein